MEIVINLHGILPMKINYTIIQYGMFILFKMLSQMFGE